MAGDNVGVISKENGAYLVQLTADGTEDVEAHRLFAAAGSLATAKRVLKQMATEYGCTKLRWRQRPRRDEAGVQVEFGAWWLDGVPPDWDPKPEDWGATFG